jgi:hypothetical protein
VRRKQLLILTGMLGAVLTCLIVTHLALGARPAGPVPTADRLALVARWMLVPGLCLLAGIGFTANRRFLDPAAIDGERQVPSRSFEINLRYNLNTLEQTVLAAIAWTGLALTLAPQDLGLVPALAGLFAVGRATFWIGYLLAPWARAYGLGLTAYPTFASLAWLTWGLFT